MFGPLRGVPRFTGADMFRRPRAAPDSPLPTPQPRAALLKPGEEIAFSFDMLRDNAIRQAEPLGYGNFSPPVQQHYTREQVPATRGIHAPLDRRWARRSTRRRRNSPPLPPPCGERRPRRPRPRAAATSSSKSVEVGKKIQLADVAMHQIDQGKNPPHGLLPRLDQFRRGGAPAGVPIEVQRRRQAAVAGRLQQLGVAAGEHRGENQTSARNRCPPSASMARSMSEKASVALFGW